MSDATRFSEQYPILEESLSQHDEIKILPRTEEERFLTADEVLFLQDDLIKRTGGLPGLRDRDLLESAVMAPQAGFGTEHLYPDTFTQAAALLRSLALNHAFLDGNKRVAFHATAWFLYDRGHDLEFIVEEGVRFMVETVLQRAEVEDISQWLEKHAGPVKPGQSSS